MTCPNCRCPACRAAAVNAVLARAVSRETESPRSLDLINESDTFGGLRPGRFRERRELGKPPVDPDAEKLAADVVLEHARAG